MRRYHWLPIRFADDRCRYGRVPRSIVSIHSNSLVELPSILHLTASMTTSFLGYTESAFVRRAIALARQTRRVKDDPDAGFSAEERRVLRCRDIEHACHHRW